MESGLLDRVGSPTGVVAPKVQGVQASLFRLDILECRAGVCLFERVWKWSGPARPEGLCKLVLTFYQLSKDLLPPTAEAQLPVVSQVLFEVPHSTTASLRDRDRVGSTDSTTARYVGGSYKQKEPGKKDAIRMACQRNEHIIVAVFHDASGEVEVMRELAGVVLQQFWAKHGKKVVDIGKVFTQVEDTDAPMSTTEILKTFEGFPCDSIKDTFIQDKEAQSSDEEQ